MGETTLNTCGWKTHMIQIDMYLQAQMLSLCTEAGRHAYKVSSIMTDH